jgi:hypothetical protein
MASNESDDDFMDDEEYFAEMKTMFKTRGWELLTQELADNIHLLEDIQDIKDEKDLYTKQGKLAAIALIINFPSTIQRAEEENSEGSE